MIRVTGVKEAAGKLKALGAEAERVASREIVASALDVQGQAKRLLTSQGAVDTGRLRNSVTVAPTDGELARLSDTATGGDSGSAGGNEADTMVVPGMLEAWVGTNVHYGPAIEFGARGRYARPYLVPALEGESPKLRRRLERALKRMERP